MEVNSSTKQSSLSKEKIQKKGFKVKVDQGEHHYRRKIRSTKHSSLSKEKVKVKEKAKVKSGETSL